jgi:hypothetical protein
MKTRFMFSVLASLVVLASSASAQETEFVDGGIVGPLPTAGLIPCFKFLDEPEFCHLTVTLKQVKYTAPFNVIDINGEWRDQDGYRPYFHLYTDPSSGGGYALDIDLSLVNRPHGIGNFIGEQTIQVYFPDVGTLTGTFEGNGRTLVWSNGTVWSKQ